MKIIIRALGDWGVLAGTLAGLVAATSCAWSAYHRAGASIHRLNSLGTALSEVSRQARDSVRSAAEMRSLADRKRDLESRMDDCRKPSLVAAQISENTRSVGASVLEIKPLDMPRIMGPMTGATGPIYPKYQVSIMGNYQQVSEFMKRCPRQRLPVRIAEFILTRVGDADEGNPRLRADVTVESFQNPRKDAEAASQTL